MQKIVNRLASITLIFSLLLALPVSVLAQDAASDQAALASAPLVASINSPSNGASFDINQNIDFSLSASGGNAPYTYVWSFDDGSSDVSGQSISKSFSSAGAKTVSLVVADFTGARAVDSVTLNINSPTVAFDASISSPSNNGSFNVGQNIDFAISASGGTAPYTYLWSFGDGSADVAGQTVSHSYSTSGAKVVTATASDFDGAHKVLTLNLTINQNNSGLDASITSPSNNSSFDIDQSISFAASATGGTAPYTYLWNFGDGSANVGGQTVSKSYSSSGSKTATLTVTDFVGATKTATVAVNINTNGGGGGGNTKPVISNIRVTDVTETSAIVRWDTDRAANSRVIYDTTSRPSISGAAYPNFGYALSSGLQDDSVKVTAHAVTLTGLSSNTTYYYRVLSQ